MSGLRRIFARWEAKPHLAGVVRGVAAGVGEPLVGELVFGEHCVHRTAFDARVAVDALLGVDEELLGISEPGLVRCRVDAVDGTDLDAGCVLGADARLCDHVRHRQGRI